MIYIVRVKPYIVLYRKSVKNYFPFFCRSVKISIRSSNLILDLSFDTYMPIFISPRLANSSIRTNKQTNPSVLIYKIIQYLPLLIKRLQLWFRSAIIYRLIC